MWILNNDTKKWTPNVDTLEVSDYQSLKQDLKFLRFYQRVLSASTFVRMDDLGNIYDVLTNYKAKNYNYSPALSPYVSPYINPIKNSSSITSTASLYDFKEKSLPEYGLTLKNLLLDDDLTSIIIGR